MEFLIVYSLLPRSLFRNDIKVYTGWSYVRLDSEDNKQAQWPSVLMLKNIVSQI